MELVHPNSYLLRTKCENFDFINPKFDPINFAQELIKFMYEHNGIGLAANQVGFNVNVFCMRGEPENFVCYNPKIMWRSEEIVLLEEGCLSYPGLIIPLKKYKSIRLRFQTPNGDTLTKIFTDMTARVVQHEILHLNGQLFWDGISRIQFERAKKKCNLKVTFNGLVFNN
jgi:peptide deformylase